MGATPAAARRFVTVVELLTLSLFLRVLALFMIRPPWRPRLRLKTVLLLMVRRLTAGLAGEKVLARAAEERSNARWWSWAACATCGMSSSCRSVCRVWQVLARRPYIYVHANHAS